MSKNIVIPSDNEVTLQLVERSPCIHQHTFTVKHSTLPRYAKNGITYKLWHFSCQKRPEASHLCSIVTLFSDLEPTVVRMTQFISCIYLIHHYT